MHSRPEGTPRDVGGLGDHAVPAGHVSWVPIACPDRNERQDDDPRMLAHILKWQATSGQTTTDGVMIDGNATVEGDMTGPYSANMVLRDPTVDIAVLETSARRHRPPGLGYNFWRCRRRAEREADHLGLGGVDTLEGLARSNASSRKSRAARWCSTPTTKREACRPSPAQQIMYVTTRSRHELVREHIRSAARGRSSRGVNGDQIVIYDNGRQMPLI